MTQKPNSKLSSAMQLLIQEAYSLFTHPLGTHLTDVCTVCCVSKENEKLLIETPVKDLSRELIYDYLGAAFTDYQSNEIAHFLPRVLELIAEYEDIRVDTEIALDKCHFERNCWSQKQLDFLRRYATQLVTDLLLTPPTRTICSPVSYMVMFETAGISFEHLLPLWEKMIQKYDTALEHLEFFMYFEMTNYRDYHSFFYENPVFTKKINDWAESPQTAKWLLPRIEKYCLDEKYTDAEMQDRFEALHRVFAGRV